MKKKLVFGLCVAFARRVRRRAPAANPLPQPAPTAAPPTTRPARPSPAPSRAQSCPPTHDDGVSPSYQPNTPARSVVGAGHVLTGVVLSSKGCAPVANAKLELWPEQAGKGHPDAQRATITSDEQGRYRFECDPPEHIHMRISAPGFRTIGVNSYHPDGQAEGRLDIVLTAQ